MERFLAADLHVSTKPDRTHVTDADKSVEEAIVNRLADARPGDAILGEEFGEHGGASRQWIIDPIDGTANFMRGVPVWATLISLVVDGDPVVGVVSAPALGRRWWAAAGYGAYVDADLSTESTSEERRIQVSEVADIADSSFSYNSFSGWDEIGRSRQLVEVIREVWRDRAYGDFWPYMLVAEGSLDACGEPDLKPWDIAALVPIVREAGGTFTSIDGGTGVDTGSALATNGLLHDAYLQALAAERFSAEEDV